MDDLHFAINQNIGHPGRFALREQNRAMLEFPDPDLAA
jgi:hypothetical protein